MRCTGCDIDYPNDLVAVMYSSIADKKLCGICYLEISNQIHGLKRKKLDGPIAEEMRQKALKWRKEHKERGEAK